MNSVNASASYAPASVSPSYSNSTLFAGENMVVDDLENFSVEQIAQLYELHLEAKKPLGPDMGDIVDHDNKTRPF